MSKAEYDPWSAIARIERELFTKCNTTLGAAPPNVLHHYTSSAGLLGILTSGTLFLSDAAFLNDSSEITYARSVVCRVIEHRLAREREPRMQELYEIALEEFTGREAHVTSGFRYYVACFCEAADLLSQWRAYGSPGCGYAIGFSGDRLVRLGGRFAKQKSVALRRVIYDTNEQEQILETLIDCWRTELPSLEAETFRGAIMTLLFSLSMVLPQFKHPVFSEEREWRAITFLYGDSEIKRLRFRQSGSSITPDVEFKIRTKGRKRPSNLPVIEIAHAPAADPEFRKLTLRELLRSLRYSTDDVGVAGSEYHFAVCRYSPANSTVKLMRPGFGPAAELPAPCWRDGVTPVADHVALFQLNRGNRRAARDFGTRDQPHSLP